MYGKDFLCPRCKFGKQGDRVSATDNTTRICNDCAKSEDVYMRLVGKPVPQYTWPVHIEVRA